MEDIMGKRPHVGDIILIPFDIEMKGKKYFSEWTMGIILKIKKTSVDVLVQDDYFDLLKNNKLQKRIKYLKKALKVYLKTQSPEIMVNNEYYNFEQYLTRSFIIIESSFLQKNNLVSLKPKASINDI